MFLLYVLPKKWLSYFVGKLMYVRWPGPLAQWSVSTFGKMYHIDFNEAEKPMSQYPSIGDLFLRRLKPGVRPLSESPLVHPADSVISQAGVIHQGLCLQAKDKTYSVASLCGDAELAEKFQEGVFVTYYLCPTDYHRVHSPVDGEVKRAIHIPGQLWPVNSWSTKNIKNLFAVNERVVLEIESRLGSCLLVFVGATNVGQIHLAFDPSIVTNIPTSAKTQQSKIYSPPIAIKRAEELGSFSMGSTVVMIYPKSIRLQQENWSVLCGKKVKLGEALL